MTNNDFENLRSAAEVVVNNSRTMAYRTTIGPLGNIGGGQSGSLDLTRTHSINLITEEFLGGYMQDGRMSVIRRFFCLFVTFDLFFVALMWLICIVLNGDNIFLALQKQVMHYTIYTSLFDIVTVAILRFTILILFYALLYINHWCIIALSTSGSCLFLISKVFVYDWVDSKQQVFEVILIMASFVLSWGEAWFLDCRVLPQERHARRYFSSLTSSDRSPLMAPFLAVDNEHRPPESVADFYSPLESDHSDAEEELDEEYHQMGLNCVRNTYELLESSDWKVEKVTPKGDTIYSKQKEKIGKIYRLTARIKYPAKLLLDEMFYNVEHIPKWNPTLLESKMVRKINSYTDITYQASVGGGGGIIKSRDFVNLRCWRLFRNGGICDDADMNPTDDSDDELNRSCEGSVSTVSEGDNITPHARSVELESSVIGNPTYFDSQEPIRSNAFETLSKSLGAKDFRGDFPSISDLNEPPPLNEEFQDARENINNEEINVTWNVGPVSTTIGGKPCKDKVWINAAISIDYPCLPQTSKYVRGKNIVSGFAMREIAGKSDACIFEWVICLDLKGYIPRRILDSVYTTFMTDYMIYLRKYINELRHKKKQRKHRNSND